MPLVGLKRVKVAVKAVDKPLNNQLRGIMLQGLGNIAEGTPIDQGRAGSNWFLKVGSPSAEVTDDTSGNPHLETMPEWVLGKKLYYTNNLPYINALEYGGYRGVGEKTIASAGGIYSKLAIGGWVRTELMIMRAGIRKI